jgi:PTH1 family peptidyl-tRNA hydrolase
MIMWLIAGLGNPGRKYSRTRHNVGFMAIEEVAGRHKIDLKDRDMHKIGRGSIEGRDVLLIEPLLYMNKSGTVIQYLFKKYTIHPENLIVIHDDLDMDTGKLRIRKTGSAGGHKGVESIIQSIGTRDFIRVKIGIGREGGVPAEEYVLNKFKKDEMVLIQEGAQTASDAICSIISEGAGKAMNEFN